MDWFRHYHGLCTDPKLHRVSRVAKVRRSVVIAAWCAILETASQNDPRGSAADLDADSLAFMVDEAPATAARVLAALHALGLLTGQNQVAAWERRQRRSDDVASRVARHRSSRHVDEQPEKKDEPPPNPLNGNGTAQPGNVTETACNAQRRTEKIREDKTLSSWRSESSDSPARPDPDKAATPIELRFVERCEVAGANPATVRNSIATWREAMPSGKVLTILDAATDKRDPYRYAGKAVGCAITELEAAKHAATQPEQDPWLETIRRNRQRDEEQGHGDFTSAPRSLLN